MQIELHGIFLNVRGRNAEREAYVERTTLFPPSLDLLRAGRVVSMKH